MKLSDIVALAKQGYKVSDIKELMALADDVREEPKEEQEEPKEEQEEPKEEQEEPKEEQEEPKKEPDYKAMYEESQKKLKEAQAANRKSDKGRQEPKTPEQVALEHFNSILK